MDNKYIENLRIKVKEALKADNMRYQHTLGVAGTSACLAMCHGADMNRAYIALGKIMYDSRKKGTEINDAECEKLLKVIDTSKAKIAKARECYRKIVDCSNDIFYGNPEVAPEVKEDDIVDITVACSTEDDYKSSPFKEEKPVEKQPEAVTEEKAEPEHLTNICDLKAELEAKREEGFSESADSDEADDGAAPHGELF